jgi:hypothetical protein
MAQAMLELANYTLPTKLALKPTRSKSPITIHFITVETHPVPPTTATVATQCDFNIEFDSRLVPFALVEPSSWKPLDDQSDNNVDVELDDEDEWAELIQEDAKSPTYSPPPPSPTYNPTDAELSYWDTWHLNDLALTPSPPPIVNYKRPRSSSPTTTAASLPKRANTI